MAAENVNLVTLASNFKETTLYIAWSFSFILDDWTTYGWSQAPPDLELFSEVYGPEDISQLPFGPTKVQSCAFESLRPGDQVHVFCCHF